MSAAQAQAEWQRDLFLDLGDVWRARAPITVRNDGAADVAGLPVTVTVGAAAGQLDLAAARSRDIRVCDDAGTEMLFDVRSPDGQRLEDAPIPAGSVLAVPATVPAGGTQRLWVYFDHPATYPVPDYLAGAAGLANPGFERGETVPDDWSFDGGDAQRRLSWVTDVVHGGERAVRCQVDAGAEPSWIAARQQGLAVVPGARYRLTAQVRGADVIGRAGWYVHVATADDPQAINKLVDAGDGTFDWRPVSIEFTAPAGATSISHGTVLYGTGTAWYDDVALSTLDEPAVSATGGAVERLELAEVRQSPAGAGTWLPIRIANPGPAIDEVLVQVPIAAAKRRLPDAITPDHVRLLGQGGEPLPVMVVGDSLLFLASLPAATLLELPLELGQAGPALTYPQLLDHPGNQVRNASFEQGDTLPTDWPGSSEGGADTGAMKRVRGGKFGDWAAELTVPDDAPLRWTGWRQNVPVMANTTWFFAAWAATEDIRENQVKLHAHLTNAAGELTGRRFWSTGGSLTGDSDWTQLDGVIDADAATEIIELHLTMNARGTLRHDGVVLMRTIGGVVGELAEVGGGGLRVWPVDPIIKVFRDTPPIEPAPLALAAARNEGESLQLCVRTDENVPVTVTVASPTNGGVALPLPRIERVGYVPCLQPGGYFNSEAQPWERHVVHSGGRTDGWLGWWPDYLAPVAGPVAVEANRTQPFWLTFSIPKGTPPGLYTGSVRVQAGERVETRPLTVKVWTFTLPDRPSLQVIYDLRNGRGNPVLHNRDDYERWWRFMASKRVSTDHVVPEPGTRLVDGRVEFDFSEYDQTAALLYDDLHMSAGYFPRVFYVTGWAHPPRPFFGFEFPTAEYKGAYQNAVRDYWAHVRQKGWADRLSLYISDEPHYWHEPVIDWLGQCIDFIREAEPEVPVYSSTWGHVPQWDDRLNHWGVAQYGRFPVDELRERQAAGDKLWFTTDGQMEITTPYNACERLLPYYCFHHGLTGYEFWGISWYTYDPYKYGWHAFIHQSSEPGVYRWVRYPNGDGYLAYPGGPLGVDGPISTIRLEQAREGIEDYELLVALRDAVERQDPAPDTLAIAQELEALALIPNAAGYRSTEILPDPSRLTNLRLAVGDLLEQLHE